MRISYFVFFIFSLACIFENAWTSGESTNASTDEEEPNEPTSQTGNQDCSDTGDKTPFLRITGELKDQRRTSGENTVLKCKAEGWPNEVVEYTWYKNDMLFDYKNDHRIIVQNKVGGSRMRFRGLLTSDSGEYRCEVSNGCMRVHTSARLTVSFKLPSLDGHVTKIPQGKCEVYSGHICQLILGGETVYVDPFLKQRQMEQGITNALQHITESKQVSKKCKHFALPAVCNFIFAPCQFKVSPTTGKKKAVPVKLCREDCELMKHVVCAKEYLNRANDQYLQEIFNTANCSALPTSASPNTQCTKIGLPSTVEKTHTCYNGSGTSYAGLASRTKSGKRCKSWPVTMVGQHKELAGGHNYCRNPGNQMNAPWCFVDVLGLNKEVCSLKKCVPPDVAGSTDMVAILVPSVAVPFLIACVVFAYCFCRKRSGRNDGLKHLNVASTPGKAVDMTVISTRKRKVPALNASSVHLMNEIGDSQYGKVYKAKVFPNPQFSTKFPVAVKTLRECYLSSQLDDFQREMDVFSELQHENVACLKAVVIQPSLRCMIFEYTSSVDLHEYVVSHSPQSDFAKPTSSASSHASSVIEQADFVSMASQVASGMEYLTSNNYVHRDLAARNVLVCGNMELKICNLGVVRDSYLSSYYRSPQGGQMLPIRWMAPESLQSWQFSGKSSVWSFGVLLWEMFSYGLQPYCGYSNHEVLDMISRRQLLTCPDQCPAKVYSLMHECWIADPQSRPQFSDLRAKLQGWEHSNNGRVTSQLAQGIHRQLNNVMRDGNGQYNQYYQTSSIGGSSAITYSSNAPAPAPSPPPNYANAFQLPGSSTSSYMNQQTPSPSFNQYSSSPSAALQPYPNPSGSYQTNYSSNQPLPVPPHHQYTGSLGGMQQQIYPGRQFAPLQRRGPGYRQGPSSHSSRSSSSCASSSRDQYPPAQPLRQISGVVGYNQENSSQPPFSGPGNRPLSGVTEDEDDTEEQYYKQPIAVRAQASSPHPPLVVKTTSPGQHPTTENNSKTSEKLHFNEADSSDMSTTSIKATSCDSGLPVDDVDAQAIDPKAPLMGKNSRYTNRPQMRGSTPMKFS